MFHNISEVTLKCSFPYRLASLGHSSVHFIFNKIYPLSISAPPFVWPQFCSSSSLAVPCSLQDLISLTRDWTPAPNSESKFLTTGSPGSSPTPWSFCFLMPFLQLSMMVSQLLLSWNLSDTLQTYLPLLSQDTPRSFSFPLFFRRGESLVYTTLKCDMIRQCREIESAQACGSFVCFAFLFKFMEDQIAVVMIIVLCKF